MKYKRVPAFVLLCIWLIILVGESSGIVRSDKASDITVDAVNEYLEQNKLTCSDIICDNTLIKSVLSYKEAINAAASSFGSKTSRIKPYIKDNLKSVQYDIESLMENVKYQIDQLQLKGRLTNDKVKQILDKAHNEVLQKKIMTEGEWKDVCQNLWSIYKPSKWYKKVFKSSPLVSHSTISKLEDLMQTMTQHINSLGILTENQNTDIINLIRESIENKNYGQWTMNEWMEVLSNSIEEKTGLNKDVLYQVIESIKDSLIEFKLNESHSDRMLPKGLEDMFYWFFDELKNTTSTIKASIYNADHTAKITSMWNYDKLFSSRWFMFVRKDFITLYSNIKVMLRKIETNIAQNWNSQTIDNESLKDPQQVKATSTLILGYPDIKPSSASNSFKNLMTTTAILSDNGLDETTTTNVVVEEPHSKSILVDYEDKIQTVYPVPTKVSEAILYSKDNLFDSDFIDPWKENEQDIYRSLGYSETHVEWIKSYLERHYRNKKSASCGDMDEATQVIGRYLKNIKIQSPCQIEKTIEILRKHLFRWRVSCDN
ncbi:hypothetical protein K501DRAFT_328976 [Backusella circina FSU 941]|nr:hypothetical protein K501DRAFT_328976 [Backusella circina FSU 941]